MDPELERRIIQLLRDAPSPALPLRRLHCTLLAERVTGVGSYARLMEDLAQRGDVFLLTEREHPLGHDGDWPAGVRSEYEAELDAAGIETGPQVTLVRHAPLAEGDALDDTLSLRPQVANASAVLQPLYRSLLDVWKAAPEQTALRGAVASALAECALWTEALAAGLDY